MTQEVRFVTRLADKVKMIVKCGSGVHDCCTVETPHQIRQMMMDHHFNKDGHLVSNSYSHEATPILICWLL